MDCYVKFYAFAIYLSAYFSNLLLVVFVFTRVS